MFTLPGAFVIICSAAIEYIDVQGLLLHSKLNQ